MEINDAMIQAVWEKGRGIPDRDQNEWRKDQCGAWLHREQYNNEKSEYGWKILNVVPGGDIELQNLQPFHRKNTFDIANDKPHCRVTADRHDVAPTQGIDQPRNTGM
jgi:hypothetical protein